jgi:hypothetical protein
MLFVQKVTLKPVGASELLLHLLSFAPLEFMQFINDIWQFSSRDSYAEILKKYIQCH